MDENKDIFIAEKLSDAVKLLEHDRPDEVNTEISEMVKMHPEWVDERLRAEIELIMKQMEYRQSLKEFSFLRGLSLVYRYCEAAYRSIGEDLDEYNGDADLPEKETIWWCWLQGVENAPEIVKCCFSSVKKLGKKVVVLDENNIKEYVKLPEVIEEKYERGVISRTHYTDLLRLELLTEKGGLWVDATAWISGVNMISTVLEDEELFFFRSGNVSEYIIFDSWFMQARKKSRILEATKQMLYSYWEKETELRHYFLMHLMMSLACRLYPDEFAELPIFSNEPAHVLQHSFFDVFSERRWKHILMMSDVHKLTYKLDQKEIRGTFLEHFYLMGD